MKDYIKKITSEGLRTDGRKLDEFRPIKIETGISNKAEGSAMAYIGNTKVMAGVKMDLTTPYSDHPDEGSLMVNFEQSLIANADWEGGPPSDETIEVARVVDRGIRESKVIDMKKLCIKEGEKAWMVMIDIYPLNYDGNIIDACALAALAALQNARIPKTEQDKKTGEYKILYGELSNEKIPLVKTPVMTTFVKIGNHIMVDPSKDEESLMDARLSITTTGKDSINALQKSGTGGLTVSEVKDMIEKSFKIKKVIEKEVGGKK